MYRYHNDVFENKFTQTLRSAVKGVHPSSGTLCTCSACIHNFAVFYEIDYTCCAKKFMPHFNKMEWLGLEIERRMLREHDED